MVLDLQCSGTYAECVAVWSVQTHSVTSTDRTKCVHTITHIHTVCAIVWGAHASILVFVVCYSGSDKAESVSAVHHVQVRI